MGTSANHKVRSSFPEATQESSYLAPNFKVPLDSCCFLLPQTGNPCGTHLDLPPPFRKCLRDPMVLTFPLNLQRRISGE